MFVCMSEMLHVLFVIAIMLLQIAENTKTVYLEDSFRDCWPFKSGHEVTSEKLRIEWRGKSLHTYSYDYCRVEVESPFEYYYDHNYKCKLCYNLTELRIPCGQKLEFYDATFISMRVSQKTYRCEPSVKNEIWCGEQRYATFKLFTESDDVSPSQYSMTLEIYVTRTEIPTVYVSSPSPDYNDQEEEEDKSTTYVIIAAVAGVLIIICCCFCCCKSSKKERHGTDDTSQAAHIPLQPPYPVSTEGAVIPCSDRSTTWDPVTQQEVTIHPFVSVDGTTNHSGNQQRYSGLDSGAIRATAPAWEPADQQEVGNNSDPPPKYSDLFPSGS